MRPSMGTRNSAGIMAGRASSQPKIGHAKAWSWAWPGRGSFFLAAAALLALTGRAVAQKSPKQAGSAQTSSTTSATLQQAEGLMQQGQPDQAKAKIQEELAQHPTSAEAYNLLGIVSTTQQDYAGALAAFQQALTIAPNSTKTLVNLGNAYVAEKNFDLAEKEYRTVLQLDPANRDANYNLGLLLMAKGAAVEAIPHFERVRPATVATQFNLVQAYFKTNSTADALRLASELSTQNKDDLQLHFSLGLMLASEKQYKAAQLEMERADVLQPGTFEILFNLGQAYLRAGDYAKADLVLNRALKLKPDSPETLYELAQVYAGDSRPLDALDLLIRAHKIAPENTDIIYLMAQVGISQNYFEDAIPLLESGIAIAPKRADLLAALGESYFMSGKVDKAVAIFQRLVEVEPSARSYAFLGLSYSNLGRFDEAKQYFERGLKLDPHNSSCLFNLGFIAERQGDTATADARFQEVLKFNPNYSDALLELANLRVTQKRLPEAAELLRRFVRVSKNPGTGYYKLAMVERSMNETAAANRDLSVFQTLSKNAPAGAYPYEGLFDYLDTRSKLALSAKGQLDITELNNEIKRHPDQPENLYLLAEAYLKIGKMDEARSAVADLDKLSAGDYRTLTGVGVLLARYHLYDEAIQHFQSALQANPDSDEVKFDLADAYFRKRAYTQALEAAGQVSEKSRTDDAYLALLGDIYAHLGDSARAEDIYRDAISRDPDNDQDYLALALLQFRQNNVPEAKATLLKGQARVPGSGKILWGLGLASVLEGNTAKAAEQFERAMEILPEWPGSYSTLGVFYFETGQIGKAKEVLDRFKNSSVAGGLDVNKIEQVLSQAPATIPTGDQPMTMANREQLLQLALSLADRTL
jgi:tetratricopeptide (TPR) repeat protein